MRNIIILFLAGLTITFCLLYSIMCELKEINKNNKKWAKKSGLE